MRRTQPPFLELSFYFANIPEHEAFERLIEQLTRDGARFTGRAWLHRGPGALSSPFESPTDFLPEQVEISWSELKLLLSDRNTRVLKVLLEDATGVATGIDEIVTYQRVSREATSIDRHPVAIWTEGAIFDGPMAEEKPAAARKAGQIAYQRFVELATSLQCSYGAITSEEPLPCPTDLRRNPNDRAFRDFFISRSYVGDSGTEKIERYARSAYFEHLDEGIFISATRHFNPKGVGLTPPEARALSKRISGLLGHARPHGPT